MLLRVSGSFPLLLREGRELRLAEGTDWKMVATTDDLDEARAVLDLVRRACARSASSSE